MRTGLHRLHLIARDYRPRRATATVIERSNDENLDFFAGFDYLVRIPSPVCRLEALARADINSRPLPGTPF